MLIKYVEKKKTFAIKCARKIHTKELGDKIHKMMNVK